MSKFLDRVEKLDKLWRDADINDHDAGRAVDELVETAVPKMRRALQALLVYAKKCQGMQAHFISCVGDELLFIIEHELESPEREIPK